MDAAAVDRLAAEVAEALRPRIIQIAEAQEALLAKLTEDAVAKSGRELARWRENARNRLRQGRAPRRFDSDILPTRDIDRIWAQLEKARTPRDVDRAFGLAKAKDPRKARVTAHYAPLIQRGLAGRWNGRKLARGWLSRRGGGGVAKAAGPLNHLERAYVAGQAPGAGELKQLLSDLYADGYAVGSSLATDALAALGPELKPDVQAIDWSSWQPGNPAAARRLAGPGLTELLDGDGVTIHGLTETEIDRLGDLLAAAAERGDSVDTIAALIDDLLNDPGRAEMIATTELNRAVSAATLDTYGLNGVAGKSWGLGPNPCPECQLNADDGPVALAASFSSGDDAPPAHPRCECDLIPEFDFTEA